MADLLYFRRGPLAKLHTQSIWKASWKEWPRGQRLYGIRGVYKPTMAAKTIQRLGDVRHALAQRCISGVLEVHAPFTKLSDEAKELVDKTDEGRKKRKDGKK